MHVVFVHDKPLPVATYGGTERILYWHMKALAKSGHRVTLIGHPESKVREHSINLVVGDKTNWSQKIPEDADIVHLFFPWQGELSKPYICRIGGNGKPGETFPRNTIFVSKSHAANHGAECFVYNGLDLEEYPRALLAEKSATSQWKSFAFLAKAAWKVKNLKDCVRAIKASPHAHLHIGGGRAWTLSPRVHSYGMVDQRRKFEIFARTDALLWPIRWPEPFGIAMIEAMAAGLAVIASPHGSSAEVISPEVGIICSDYASFAQHIENAPRTFRPQQIRDYVETNFSAARMCDDYIACYEKVLNGEFLNREAPIAKFSLGAETLLPF